MAVLSAILGTIAAVSAVAGAATSIATATQGGKDNAPVYNAEAEKKKAAMQEAEANKKRIMGETNTVRTSALGNTGDTQIQKKTVLGG